MKIDTEKLIESLSKDATVRKTASPAGMFAIWLTASMVYVGILLLHYSPREDLVEKLRSPLFMAEIALLFCLILTSAFSAMLLSFPDLYQKRKALFVTPAVIALFLIVLGIAYVGEPASPKPVHGIECTLCIATLAILPGIFMLWMLQRQASTHYYMAGSICLLAASSIGCLTLRLSEKTDSIAHVVNWHYLPVLGFCALGIWLGGKLLKW